MKFILILFVFLNLFADIEPEDCKVKFSIAWKADIEGNEKLANKITQDCKRELSIIRNWFDILEAKIFFTNKEYQKVLKILNSSRTSIIKTFLIAKDRTKKTSIQYESPRFFYLNMLTYSAFSNYKLQNWELAVIDFELYLKEEENNFEYIIYLASCYSELNFYKKSILELKKAYSLNGSDDVELYIASVYAKSKNTKESIYWLRKISDKNIMEWINDDDNFNTIKKTKEYKNFTSSHGFRGNKF